VIHAAAVLEDGILIQQDPARFRKALAPKVLGAWNLHALSRGAPLDFFVLYSSASALLGTPGQGNYNAGNAFLDALAHYRRGLGLPALSINWGAFAEAGMAAAQANRGARLSQRGIRSLSLDEGELILTRLLRSSEAQVGAVPLDVRQWVEFYPQSAGSPRFAALVAGAKQGRRLAKGEDLKAALLAAPAGEHLALLERFIAEQLSQVAQIALSQIDRDTPFTSLGLDSLMGLEMRNRLEMGSGLELSATLLWTYPSLGSLGKYLYERLALLPKEDDPSGIMITQEMPALKLDELSDAELASLGETLLS
jgi:acyl carrier protein